MDPKGVSDRVKDMGVFAQDGLDNVERGGKESLLLRLGFHRGR